MLTLITLFTCVTVLFSFQGVWVVSLCEAHIYYANILLAAWHKHIPAQYSHKWELFHTAHFHLKMRTQHLNSTVPAPHIQRRRGFVCLWANTSYCRNHMNSRLTVRYVIYFLSPEIPLIFQLRDFICFESTNILIRGEVEAVSMWFLISLVNNNHLQFIASHYCDICSIWDYGILGPLLFIHNELDLSK